MEIEELSGKPSKEIEDYLRAQEHFKEKMLDVLMGIPKELIKPQAVRLGILQKIKIKLFTIYGVSVSFFAKRWHVRRRARLP